jgi:hypothetical protein
LFLVFRCSRGQFTVCSFVRQQLSSKIFEGQGTAEKRVSSLPQKAAGNECPLPWPKSQIAPFLRRFAGRKAV